MAFGNKFIQLGKIKFELFKSQNPEVGRYDVTFEIDGKFLYAHKNKLNLVSHTFDALLSDRWNSNKEEPIKILGYGYDNFYQFLTFLYSGQCQLADTNIYAMVDIAEFYGVELFKEYCNEYLAAMKITTENIFKLMELADNYSMTQLKSSSYNFIVNNFQSFVNGDGFSNVNKSYVKELVTVAKDRINPEELFQAVYKWCEKQGKDKQASDSNINLHETIKVEISNFLPYIYFQRMSMEFLVKKNTKKNVAHNFCCKRQDQPQQFFFFC